VFAPGVAWMLLACGVALAARPAPPRQPGLWCDEIYTAALDAALDPGPARCPASGSPPALYFLIEHFAARALGDDEAALRLLSLICGVGTVALTFWAFRPVLNERLVRGLGLLPGTFAGVLPLRAHGALLLLRGAGRDAFTWAILCGWRRSRRPRSWWLYGISVALALYTSYVCVCLIVAHGVWAFVARRRRTAAVSIPPVDRSRTSSVLALGERAHCADEHRAWSPSLDRARTVEHDPDSAL